MIIETRNATIDDALFIAENIRPADVAELAAAGYTDIKAAVECSFSTSKKCRVATVDGIPVAILGVCDSAIKGVGVIWMLGTDGIYSISKRFLLGSKA
ncbi:MAG TPA: hypothetical protein PK031_10865, partial [Pseudomonadales bacterium]|nr:hypothetical protein [Pseudomonadales bacterium]